jgi:hypothetical protein
MINNKLIIIISWIPAGSRETRDRSAVHNKLIINLVITSNHSSSGAMMMMMRPNFGDHPASWDIPRNPDTVRSTAVGSGPVKSSFA